MAALATQAQNVVEHLAELALEKKAARKDDKNESSSIRVSVEKVDQLINLIGELVITKAMIEQRSAVLDPILHERLLSSVSQLDRNTRELQEAVMSIRMMPMDFVFSRFPRMVRDLAGKLGKKVDFITNGAATELDKGLIERIVDPLTHLVRNSIDHGIEMPAARIAAGKTRSRAPVPVGRPPGRQYRHRSGRRRRRPEPRADPGQGGAERPGRLRHDDATPKSGS